MSIMDTLITNRTQADVIAGNAKGNYNASDLNRVGEAEEYLHDLFEAYGYSMPNYKRIKLSRPGHYETQTVTKPILPDSYTQLEYIESTGTQYINTLLSLPHGWRIKGKLLLTSVTTDSRAVFGAQSQNSSVWARNQFQPSWGSNNWFIGIGGYQYGGSPQANTEYEFDVCNIVGETSYIKINGENVALTTGQTDTGARSDLSCYLFNVHNGDGTNYFGQFRMIGKWEVYNENHNLVGNYVPAKRNSDGEIAVYDLVTQDFLPNAGTGTFIEGSENIEYETITEEVLVPDERDPYTWFEDDIPTSGMMAQYITNLSELRGQFVQAETTPSVPPKMNELTWKEANNIEKILEDVDALLTNISAAWFFSGDLFSGEV